MTRRIVTGIDDQGQSKIIKDDGGVCFDDVLGLPGCNCSEIWKTEQIPADSKAICDIDQDTFHLLPSKNGTVCRVFQLPPEKNIKDALLKAQLTKSIEKISTHEVADVDTSRHPLMHKTETVDYAIILSGKITLILDNDEIDLKAGDVVVQRATAHAWSNRTNEPCTIAFILIDANSK